MLFCLLNINFKKTLHKVVEFGGFKDLSIYYFFPTPFHSHTNEKIACHSMVNPS